MIEANLKLLNIQELLEKNFPAYVEYFVKYYGEEKREWIEEQFSKVMIIGFLTPDSINRYLMEIKREISKKIEKKYLEKINAKEDENFYFLGDSFAHYNQNTFTDYYNFFQSFLLGEEGRKKEFIKKGYLKLRKFIDDITEEDVENIVNSNQIPEKFQHERPWTMETLNYYKNPDKIRQEYDESFQKAKRILDKINPNISLENFKEYLNDPRIKELNLIAALYPEMFKDYKEYSKKLKSYEEDLEEYTKKANEADEECLKEFVLDSLSWIPEEKREQLKNHLMSNDKNYALDSFYHSLFGYRIASECLIDSFSRKSNELLKDSKTPEWEKDLIKSNREKYWELIGEKKVPTEEDVEEFKNNRKKYINKKNIKAFDGLSKNKKIREKINNLQLLDKDDYFNAKLYHTKYSTAVNPNIRKTDHGIDSFSLLMVCGNDPGTIDHNVIHELNHLLELSLKEVKDDYYQMYCGWEIFKLPLKEEQEEKINTLEDDDSKRNYELFNEIMNEIITQEIYKKMVQDNIYIVDDKSNAVQGRLSEYDKMFFIGRDFFNEFKDKIIESRQKVKIQIIWNEVGKENFDELSKLFDEFFEYYYEKKIDRVLREIHQGIENEDTKKYLEITSKKNEILRKMKTYKMLQEEGKELNESYHY